MSATCTDTVFLEKLSIKGKHGVHAHEREIEQEFLIDIAASFDTRKAAASEDLKDTLDYSRFRTIAIDTVSRNSFFLIETLAERIAQQILEDDRIASVSVTVRKPAAYQDTTPGITIVRTRA